MMEKMGSMRLEEGKLERPEPESDGAEDIEDVGRDSKLGNWSLP